MFEYDHRDAETAWPEGQYQAIFLGALDTTAKSSGQPMQVWEFEVYDDLRDRKQNIKDYVTKASLFKVRMLAAALNKSAEFKANKFYPEDHAGAAVMVSLKIEESEGFDDKNKINRISARPPGGQARSAPASAAEKMLTPPERGGMADKARDNLPVDSAGAGIPDYDDIPF